jgi:hypothetical protein
MKKIYLKLIQELILKIKLLNKKFIKQIINLIAFKLIKMVIL